MKRIEFYFDLISPYSYLAYTQMGRICGAHGAELVLRPMLLGAVHKSSGARPATEIPAKEHYMLEDLELWAEHYGVPMRFPEPFPFRTLKTMRAAVWCAGRSERDLDAFVREAFGLYWEEGGAPKGLGEEHEDGPIREVARRIRANPEEVLRGATEPETKQALKNATSAALERGVFGAPTFFVGDKMFWGNDRLHFVEEALTAQRSR